MAIKLTKRDFDEVARSDLAELDRRKTSEDRVDLEKRWDQVDRQVSLEHVKNNDILPDWVPDLPIPNQANALEVIQADVDRLQFPDTAEFFSVHSEITEQYIDRLTNDINYLGRDIEQEARIDQEDIDAITQAAILHAHKQYNFKDHMAQVDAEALRYGTFCGRLRSVSLNVFNNHSRGVSRTMSKLPAFLPLSVRNTYLDDKSVQSINSGSIISPREMFTSKQNIDDLKMSALKGSSDTEKMDGGWRKAEVAKLESPGADKLIELLEVEGDMLIPRSGKDVFIPNVIVTHAISKGGPVVVRVRENKMPFNSLFHGTYFKEKIGQYGVSPLMKGASIHAAATDMLNAMLATAWMNAGPPVGWNRSDMQLRASGGPDMHPYAAWDSMSDIKVHSNIGNMQDALEVYLALNKQYEEVTGVSSPRTGAQTKSHQTAFAVNSEVERGQTRTINFVRNKSRGFHTDILNAELSVLRKDMPKQSIYVPKFRSYVQMSGKSLPDNATFMVAGAASPIEASQRDQAKIAILSNMLQLEGSGMVQQLGGKPLDIDKVREELIQAGIPEADVGAYFKAEEPQPTGLPQGVPGAEPAEGNLPGNVEQIAGRIGFQP